jgi:hypothetical protein
LTGGSGHRDIAGDRSFDALAECLRGDEDNQVDSSPFASSGASDRTRDVPRNVPSSMPTAPMTQAVPSAPVEDPLNHLSWVAQLNDRQPGGRSRSTLIGAPMRGIAGSSHPEIHLAAWRTARLEARSPASWLARDQWSTEAAGLREIPASDPLSWARVYEHRPQVTRPRDQGHHTQWLRGKSVLLLAAQHRHVEHVAQVRYDRLDLCPPRHVDRNGPATPSRSARGHPCADGIGSSRKCERQGCRSASEYRGATGQNFNIEIARWPAGMVTASNGWIDRSSRYGNTVMAGG